MTTVQLGAFTAFLSSCTWAVGTAMYSRLTRHHTAFAVNLARSLLALPLFVISAFVVAGGLNAGLADFRAVGATGTLWFFVSTVASYGLGDAVFLMSTQSLGVPGALAIASTYPMWTAAAGWLFEGQALATGQAVGLLLTLAGVAIVILFAPGVMSVVSAAGSEGTGELATSADAQELSQAQAVAVARRARVLRRLPLRGVALALATSLFWALNGYCVFRGGRGISMSVANSVRMAFAVLLSPIMALLLARGTPMFLPMPVIRRSLWLFGMEAFGGSALFVYGMCHSPLAIGATLSALAPVISVPVAVVMRLEKFSFGRTAGVLIAVVGLRLLVG